MNDKEISFTEMMERTLYWHEGHTSKLAENRVEAFKVIMSTPEYKALDEREVRSTIVL